MQMKQMEETCAFNVTRVSLETCAMNGRTFPVTDTESERVLRGCLVLSPTRRL